MNLNKHGVPFTTYVIWFGDKMKGDRLQGFINLKENIGTPLVLLGEENIFDYEVENHPFHPVVKDTLRNRRGLSGIHLSDYFRNYLSFHHGGAYHDIKSREESIAHCWGAFSDSNIWIVGMEQKKYPVSRDEYIERYINRDHSVTYGIASRVTGNGAFIARPQTKLFEKILMHIERRLDCWSDLIAKHPVPNFKRCCQAGEISGYPVVWASLHGDIKHPYESLYWEHISHSMPRWAIKKYRTESENV